MTNLLPFPFLHCLHEARKRSLDVHNSQKTCRWDRWPSDSSPCCPHLLFSAALILWHIRKASQARLKHSIGHEILSESELECPIAKKIEPESDLELSVETKIESESGLEHPVEKKIDSEPGVDIPSEKNRLPVSGTWLVQGSRIRKKNDFLEIDFPSKLSIPCSKKIDFP